MRVNFSFTSFLTNRVVVRSCIAIAMLIIFSIASSFTDPSDHDLRAKQVNLIIRQIGHRLLLQAGDSTSRVLPVTEIKEGTFLLKFESEFVFSHDSLLILSQGFLTKTQFPSGYTLTVHDCKKGEIVYGFQVNNTIPDILPCRGRSQPRGCYTMEFVFPDLYESIVPKKAAIDHRTNTSKLAKADVKGVNLKPEKLKPTTVDYNIDKETKEFKTVKVDTRETNPKHDGSNPATLNYTLNNVVYAGMLVLLVAAILIWRFGKNLKSVPPQNPDGTIRIASVPELASLGKFLFYEKGQHLLLGNEVISLTDKECKVLTLLHKNFGELIPREMLMQEVWINEGVITGRSLDMFVSKLRKKLSSDPDLRITNVHGKGYKLEIVEREII